MIHLALMALYAFVLSTFFALLARRSARARFKLFAILFVCLMGGGLALGWLMFPFPSGPPAPIP